MAKIRLNRLFDKDSQNRADFEIKTIDPKTGKAINGLDHEVEGTLEIDGKELTLRKNYYEIWTRKRGIAEKVFTGHSTDHTINKVPVKKSEYEERIAQIAGSESTFRLLTDPGYFNEVLHWRDDHPEGKKAGKGTGVGPAGSGRRDSRKNQEAEGNRIGTARHRTQTAEGKGANDSKDESIPA